MPDTVQEAAHAAAQSGATLVPILIFLAAAVIAVPVFRLAGLGAIVGYLAAGIAIGPTGFGLIGDPAATMHVAELGVVLLLFIIGLELKPVRLLAMRRDISFLGGGQMVITTLVLAGGLMLLAGFAFRTALIAAIALSFSSTAIAVQLLNERGARETSYGRRAFAILLFQDVMVAPVLAVIPLLAGGSATGGWQGALAGFAGVVTAFAIVIFAGRYILNPLFSVLARSGAGEVMTAAALLVVLGAAVLMQIAGMSMALGAFLAGLLLSESRFRHELEANIEPFRGLLMGLFFMSVGMSLDGGIVAASALWLAVAAVLVILVKGAIVFALMRTSRCTQCDALSGASVLTMAGEFAFVVFPVAVAAGLMTMQQAGLLAALTALTMIVSPLLAKLVDVAAKRPRLQQDARPAEEIPDDAKGSVLVVGFGRFGQLAVQVLLAGRADVTVIDTDEGRIRSALRFGFKVYYGDGSRLDVLRAAGAERARVLAICVDNRQTANTIVEIAKQKFPLTKLYVRAYDRVHALELLDKGVDHFQRETAESAMLFGGALFEELSADPEKARELVDFVRQRDAERLALQRTEGLMAGTYHPEPPTPEPLVKPDREATALSEDTARLADEAEPAAGAPDAGQNR
ncbi:MAG: monovalent cation:proton antiporter-2 (CPA2) family protein [Hyphomicrobiales bacterium]|nr:monovalent cation:proton antiporter-2 (CPA2) family protein [Hyphomicrobiales bacterium]